RRNLQAMYADQLIGLALGELYWNAPERARMNPPTPEQARSLARLELSELQTNIEQVVDSGSINRDTKAHLLDTHARITQALEAPLVLPAR
ncbi:MAG: hypothetical protein AAF970_17995, partial [Bacteroidota bacterium]